MSSITIKFRDGTTREFPHEGRAGGSYTKRVTFEGVFVVITDEYGTRTALPAADIAEVIDRPERGSW